MRMVEYNSCFTAIEQFVESSRYIELSAVHPINS